MLMENAIKSSSKRRAPVPKDNTADKELSNFSHCFIVPCSFSTKVIIKGIAFNIEYSEEVGHCYIWLAPGQIECFNKIFVTQSMRRIQMILHLILSIILWENSLDELGQLGTVDKP